MKPPADRAAVRTELTAEQYSELVVTLEAMRVSSACGFTPSLTNMWIDRQCGDWCLIYLTQWFHIVGQHPENIPHMINELYNERR